MKRSPLVLIFLLSLAAMLAWSQSNSAEPQPASGTPKTPMGGISAPTGKPAAPASPTSVTTPVPTSEAPPSNAPESAAPESGLEPLVEAPVEPEPDRPKTEIFDSSATSGGLVTDGHDPILDPPPLPEGKATLVGGIVSGVDQIHNKMTVRVFGGGHWKIAFDERTHIFRNGAEVTQLAIRKGERIYVDTMLDKEKHEVFARNIRVGAPAPAADADGQITEVDADHGTVTLRDVINSSPIHFSVDRNTRIAYGTSPTALSALKPGSLVHVRFSPERVNRGLAREISIIAAPGSAFTYVGKITFLDVHRGLLALENVLDQRNYEIHFNPARTDARDNLSIGTEVRIVAIFEGTRYTAQSITVTRSAQAEEKEKD
ncbi:MAG TPA: DUF5666 domain-containing protein [Candidatus Angelobacter sp.]